MGGRVVVERGLLGDGRDDAAIPLTVLIFAVVLGSGTGLVLSFLWLRTEGSGGWGWTYGLIEALFWCEVVGLTVIRQDQRFVVLGQLHKRGASFRSPSMMWRPLLPAPKRLR